MLFIKDLVKLCDFANFKVSYESLHCLNGFLCSAEHENTHNLASIHNTMTHKNEAIIYSILSSRCIVF